MCCSSMRCQIISALRTISWIINVLAFSGTAHSRLIEHHALGGNGVTDERVEVLLAKDDVDGDAERLLELSVDGAACEAERTRRLDDEVNIRPLLGLASRIAAEQRDHFEAMLSCSLSYRASYVPKVEHAS